LEQLTDRREAIAVTVGRYPPVLVQALTTFHELRFPCCASASPSMSLHASVEGYRRLRGCS
jgi:hypothetical protein